MRFNNYVTFGLSFPFRKCEISWCYTCIPSLQIITLYLQLIFIFSFSGFFFFLFFLCSREFCMRQREPSDKILKAKGDKKWTRDYIMMYCKKDHTFSFSLRIIIPIPSTPSISNLVGPDVLWCPAVSVGPTFPFRQRQTHLSFIGSPISHKPTHHIPLPTSPLF